MVASFLYLVIILITLPLSILLIRFAYKQSKGSLNCPPGSYGWPILGENMQFGVSGALKFVQERMNKYSQDVFQTSLLGEKMAVICGAKGNKFFFANDTKLFTPWCPQSAKKSLFFPEFADAPVEELSAILLPSLADFIKPDALKQYIPIMDAMARKHVEMEWAPHRQVTVLPLSKKYTFDLACRIFMSMEDQQHIKKLVHHFDLVVKGISSLPINLPGTTFYSALKGGTILRDELLNIIKSRRKDLMENHGSAICQDLLSQLILMTNEKGQYFSDRVICNNVIVLLLASYETASSTITFVLKYLAEFPNIYNQVLQEQMEIANTKGPNDLLTWEDIEKMKHTWNVVRESMRVMPPVMGSFRETKTEFTYKGFTIPKGWKVFWSVYTTHMNPDIFPNPEKFDPSRFEGSGSAPYTFTPFGGGPHMCPGKEYSRLEMLTYIHNIVRRFKLEKALLHEKIVFHAIPRLEKGLQIRLQPHEKQF